MARDGLFFRSVAVVLTGLPAFYVWEARSRDGAAAARATGPE